MSLPKLNPDEVNTETQATVVDAVAVSGRDAAFVGKAIRNANLEPVATIKTGKPGRPPRVFDRTELLNAVNDAVRAETEQAAAAAVQTNTEVGNTDTQVA